MAEPFTEEEFLIILDHYLSIGDHSPMDENGLSEKLRAFGAIANPSQPEHHRTGQGLRRVIGRFAAVDSDPPTALKSYAERLSSEPLHDYRRIWDQYEHDREAVRSKACLLYTSPSPRDRS